MTNKQLAEYCHISPTAFSLIINQKPGVSDATRMRVINELKALGITNIISNASKPAEKKVKNICFVIYKKDGAILNVQPFFMLLMENLEKRARKYGYNIILQTVEKQSSMEDQIQYINSLTADGAIIFATEMSDDDIHDFDMLSKPLLAMDNNFSHLPVNSVSIDNQMGTYQAVEFLVNNGHTKIGYLAGKSRISSFIEREKGYREALHSFHIDLDPDYCYQLACSEEGSYQEFREILKRSPKLPTAFVSDDDVITAGVIRALKEFNISVPSDISMIGYNDRPICEITYPKLTTISVSKNSFAIEAIDSLMSILEKIGENIEYRSTKCRIQTKLLIRESVKSI